MATGNRTQRQNTNGKAPIQLNADTGAQAALQRKEAQHQNVVQQFTQALNNVSQGEDMIKNGQALVDQNTPLVMQCRGALAIIEQDLNDLRQAAGVPAAPPEQEPTLNPE